MRANITAMPDQRDFDAPGRRAHTVILLAAVAPLAAVCFFPLLRYFFSQDDFQLMYRAVHEPGDMLSASFGAAIAVLLVFGAVSTWKVRDNTSRAADTATRDNASFVLRRALIAQNVFDSLDAKDLDMTGVENIDMVYGWPGRRLFGGTTNDMYWGLAQGFAIRLFFAAGGTPVESVTMPTMWDPDSHEMKPGTLVLFYDPAGNCYTYDQIMSNRR